MDRSWMYDRCYPKRRGLKPRFLAGVDIFIKTAMRHEEFRIQGGIRCPCKKCRLAAVLTPGEVTVHLEKVGFKPNYFIWTAHGEVGRNVNEWNAFRDKCAWNEEKYDDALMEGIFHRKAAQRLRDLLSKAKRNKRKPIWMGEEIWEDLKKHWARPEVQKVSEINKNNRASETGGSLHTGGSISTAEHKARMEFDYGRRVGLPEIHRCLHFKKNGDPVDEYSKRLQEEYQNTLTQRCSQIGDPDSSNPVDQFEMEHETWIDVTRGMNKKRRIPGAGNLSRAYREFSESSRSSTGRSYVKDQALVNELARKLEELEKRATQLEETVSELKTQMNQGLDEMRTQQNLILQLLQGRGASISPTPRPTRSTFMPYSDAPRPDG